LPDFGLQWVPGQATENAWISGDMAGPLDDLPGQRHYISSDSGLPYRYDATCATRENALKQARQKFNRL
jgi:hypothetical protein